MSAIEPTQTVQLTSKKWKIPQLIGGALMLAAPLSLILAPKILGLFFLLPLLFVTGFLVWLIGRVGAWWFHG